MGHVVVAFTLLTRFHVVGSGKVLPRLDLSYPVERNAILLNALRLDVTGLRLLLEEKTIARHTMFQRKRGDT
jgi:hypothetical protein